MRALFITAVLAILLSSCGNRTAGTMEESSLNFILIYTDELQFSDLGCYGGDYPTPHIDRLAEEGLLFTGAYTTASMCTPSRYSVITGQFPGRCRASSFLEENPADEPYNIAWNTWITPDKKTLPGVLSENGYVTGMSGKWHVGRLPEGVELPELDRKADLDDPEVDRKLQKQQLIHREMVMKYGGFDQAASVVWGNYDSHPVLALRVHNFPWMTKGAVDFLRSQGRGEGPFFLYVAPTAIHGPNHVDDLAHDVSYTPGGKDPEVPGFRMDLSALREELQRFPPEEHHRVAGIAQTDHLVGEIRRVLEELGKSEETVIFFMADHNIEPGKATSYEKGVHVPMILHWPGVTSGGSTGSLVQNLDIYPTILEAAGIPEPGDYLLDGTSMLGVINDPDSPSREYLFTENGYTRSVTDGRYKYIALRYPDRLVEKMKRGELGHVPSYVELWPQAHSAIAMQFFPHYFDQDQLYDLETDPFEQQNIYDSMAGSEIVQRLKARLEEHLQTFDHPFTLEPDPFLESETYRELQQENRSFDIYTIPWLSRDHGEMVWPPEKE